MIIWHSQLLDPSPVGGVWRSVARLGTGLTALGHTPVLLARGDSADRSGRFRSGSDGVTTACLPVRAMRFETHALSALAAELPPDLIHLHWGFLPHHVALARWALEHDVPYVYQARGALAEGALHRRAARKSIYLSLVERKLIRRASLAIGTTVGDIRDLMRVEPAYSGAVAVVPNAVVSRSELSVLQSSDQAGDRSANGLCGYLGRWDITNKGIDRMVGVAHAAPSMHFRFHTDLHPTRDPRLAAKLLRSLPDNIEIAPPIVGDAKWSALGSFSAYLQLSRWESFGNAVAEAMVAGTPVVVAREMHISELVRDQEAGLVVDGDDPEAVAASLSTLHADPVAWQRRAACAREFSRATFTIESVTARMLDAYRSVV